MRFVFERREPTGTRMLVQVRDSVLNFRFWAGRFHRSALVFPRDL